MKTMLPLSRPGSCLLANAALRADTISALEWPASTILVRRSAIGNIDRAAWRFKHSAPLTFGFQNSGESNASIQPLSTIQTNPEHLGRNWSRSVTIKQGHELITTGPYAVVRHPIYTGILSGFLGMAISISQVRGFIVVVLVFLVFWLKLRMEEEWMRSQFGETYATYARQTAALVPYVL